ncbi:MAG TPA: HlyD family efflux transporter periplasmic adaptor subunit, partial [Burkholderiaceae bacterium]|nr:HlyD family efflux transporter periplasmic adaptor subunit [Burkholderiaceae bacterium]
EATTELRDVNSKLIDLEEQLRSARDASTRKLITAPVAGRVVDLKVTTAGGTLGPRDPVLDIVPDNSPLLVDARVGVDAIGDLRVGLHTDVRLTTYRQRDTPLIAGKVVYVSADSLTDRQSGVPYFAVHVELDREALERAGGLAVMPGMGAEVFVRTRERTAFDYLVEPLVNAMRRSLREY